MVMNIVPPTKGVFVFRKWGKQCHMGNFPNTCLLALNELVIKDWKTTYLHLPEKLISYASVKSLLLLTLDNRM